MAVGWLIDAELDSQHEAMRQAIENCGGNVRLIKRPEPPYGWDDVDNVFLKHFPAGACVVTWGDIDLVNRVRAANCWTPGVFATVGHFFCSHYYAHLGKYLLNADYIMLPFAELSRRRDFLFETLGRDDRLFVRPDSPLKTFTGQVASRATFDRDLEFMAFYEFPMEHLVIVSSPKTIVNEWRFVIADQRVVSGAHYKSEDQNLKEQATDPLAIALASEIVAVAPRFDPAWVLDICETAEHDYRLLEIGAFSYADLYHTDRPAVAEAVSKVAEELHRQAEQGG